MFSWLRGNKERDDYLTPVAMMVKTLDVAHPNWREVTITRVDGGVNVAIRKRDDTDLQN